MSTPKPANGKFPYHPLLISLIALILVISCKKIDQIVVREKPVVTLETRFFTEHAPKDTLVKSVLGFVKRENEKHHFVSKLIKKIGYPYWDKAIVAAGGNTANGRTVSDTANTVFIPFVLDNANTVNNTLIIRTNPSDTSFLILADWQYANQTYGSPSVDSTAENVALLFMLEDRSVFGYDRFKITDNNLFSSISTTPGFNGREIKMNDNSSGRTTLEYDVEVCFVSYVCPYSEDECSNGCDYGFCSATNGNPCYLVATICWYYSYDVDAGQWSTGGGGGPEGGGGAGGGWNSWEPPICEEEPQGRSTTYQDCGPGWTPPGIDVPVELEDPCSSADISSGTNATSQYSSVLKPTVLQFTPLDPNSTTQDEQYFIVNNNNGTYTPGSVQTLPTGGGAMQGVTSNTVMVVHTHPNGSNAFPSARDFFELANFGSNFLMNYVIAANGTKYAMVINDYSQLQAFVAANPNAISPSSQGFNLNTSLGAQWVVLRNKLQSQGYSLTEATERSYAHIMKQAGVTLVKAPVGSDTFKKIGIKQKTDGAGTPLVDSSGYPLYENADCN